LEDHDGNIAEFNPDLGTLPDGNSPLVPCGLSRLGAIRDSGRLLRACFVVRRIDRLGLGRSALAQEDRQEYQDADGQELALPVLQRFEPELGLPDVAEGGGPGGGERTDG